MKQVISWDLRSNGVDNTNGVLAHTECQTNQNFVLVTRKDGQREYIVLQEKSAIRGKFVNGKFMTFQQIDQMRKAERLAKAEARKKILAERKEKIFRAKSEALNILCHATNYQSKFGDKVVIARKSQNKFGFAFADVIKVNAKSVAINEVGNSYESPLACLMNKSEQLLS